MATAGKAQKGMRELRPGVWELRVYAGRLPDGKERYVSRTFRGTAREATKARAALLVEVESAKGSGATAGTFADLAERWFAHGRPGWKTRTADSYRRHLDQVLIPALGAKYTDRIRPADLDRLWASLADGTATGRKVSPATVERYAGTIKAVLNFGVRRGELARNVVQQARPPRSHRKEIAPPSVDELTRLLEEARHVDEDFGVLCWLAVATGARLGELCALRWTDVDLEAGTVRIARTLAELRSRVTEEATKNHSVRVVAIDPLTVEVLQRHREAQEERSEALLDRLPARDAFLFSYAPDGVAPMRPQAVSLKWRRLVDREGLNVRFHDLRHAAATLLLSRGVALPTVSKRLGHRSVSVTADVYSHVIDGADREAADAMGALLAGGS
jgi:integrase